MWGFSLNSRLQHTTATRCYEIPLHPTLLIPSPAWCTATNYCNTQVQHTSATHYCTYYRKPLLRLRCIHDVFGSLLQEWARMTRMRHELYKSCTPYMIHEPTHSIYHVCAWACVCCVLVYVCVRMCAASYIGLFSRCKMLISHESFICDIQYT